MDAYFELMDIDSANVVGFYPTREAALAAVRDAFAGHGLVGIRDLALSEKVGDASALLIAEGEELLRLASGIEAPVASAERR